MTRSRLIVATLALLCQLPLAAQNPSPAGADRAAQITASRAADFIVAVVNSEPITNQQVRAEVERIRRQWQAEQKPAPDLRELGRQVLSQLINERAQLQLAREMGIKVDAASIDQAELSVAKQNRLSVAQLREQLQKEDIDPQRFRDQLRDQITLNRLREREVDPRVRVSDAEVEQYLQEQREYAKDPAKLTLNMAHILVAVPSDASAAQVAELQNKADKILQRARAGEDFAALAREYSDASDRSNGGILGQRTGDRYPPLFVQASQNLQPGSFAGPLRSGAGFHIIQLLERRQAGLPPTSVIQTHARHILLVPTTQLSEAQARDKLNDFRRRILLGESDFASLARQYSQDSSAARGGDLGWANPGMFVPEFERVLEQLEPGQISQPLISRFGVHLIQLLERRSANVSERDQRELVRNKLREKKYDEVYANWARDVRARAYVELREAPL